MQIPKYLNIFLIIILFIWISFFPQPIQDHYWIYVRIFLVIFLATLVLNKRYRRNLLTFQDFPLWVFLIKTSYERIRLLSKMSRSNSVNQYIVPNMEFDAGK